MTEPIGETGILDQVRVGPEMVRRTLGDSRAPADAAARDLLGRGTRRVFVIGNGTSFWSARWVCDWYRSLATPEDPTLIALSAASFNLYRPALGATDALVAISASGEFRDIVACVEDLGGRIPVVGVVQSAASSLGRAASHVVVGAGGPSEMAVMTRTFVSTATGAALVALGLLRDQTAADRARGDIARGADAAEAAISAADPIAPELAEAIRGYGHVFVAGGGCAALAAGEAALKLTEMALLHAEGVETWEAESGAASVFGPETVVIAIHPEGTAAAATSALAVNAAGWGACVIEVAAARASASSHLLPLPVAAAEQVAPLFAVPPVTLVAYHLAVQRGITPDRPGWIGRYVAQGLRHVAGAREHGQ